MGMMGEETKGQGQQSTRALVTAVAKALTFISYAGNTRMIVTCKYQIHVSCGIFAM